VNYSYYFETIGDIGLYVYYLLE